MYDSFSIEQKRYLIPQFGDADPTEHIVRNGPATKILTSVEEIIKVVMNKQGGVTWHVGRRNSREIGIAFNSNLVTTNLFELSTGQTVLLDMFLTILRDIDLGSAPLVDLMEVRGIVVIDEIDLHLHTDLQHDTLPSVLNLTFATCFL